jgi:4-cresol dehydrogenase (hydroxylating)
MITEPVLPPGVSKEQFSQAIEEYKAIVGADNVWVEIEQLVPYFKIMMPTKNDKLYQASGAIAAKTVDEIQGVLAVCNKYKIPVWTISTGRNFGYGSAAPATPGQMVLDLRGMNKILDVDPELCTALVEPGVTYQQLHDYITENDLPLWLSFPASGPIVGPVGNSLDRGVGYNRNSENVNSICGMEVVLANGDVVRTGMGGVKDTNAWQSYKWGYGPSIDGLFQQSNFGVVTKMGMWLMPKPETYKLVMVPLRNEEDLVKAVDIQRKLRLQMVTETGVIGASPLMGLSMVMKRDQLYDGPGAIPEAELKKIAQKFGISPFAYMATLYGTQEQVNLDFKLIEKAFDGVAPVIEGGKNTPPGSFLWHWENMTTSRFDLHEFGIYNFRGAGGGSAWFAPVIPAKGDEALKSYKLNKQIMDEFGFEYTGGFVFGQRHAEHVIALEFDRTNPEELKNAYDCFDRLLTANAEIGHAPYRVNTAFMKQTADVYGPEVKKLNARLKNMFDPNGILAPGKSGIG